jgi:hypothetical protein
LFNIKAESLKIICDFKTFGFDSVYFIPGIPFGIPPFIPHHFRFFPPGLASFSSSCSSDQTVSSTDLLAQFWFQNLCNLAFLLTSIKAGLLLSIGVMEWIIASMCLKVSSITSICFEAPGIIPTSLHITHFTCFEFERKSSSQIHFSNFLFSGFFIKLFLCLSTKDTTSPIPSFFQPYE